MFFVIAVPNFLQVYVIYDNNPRMARIGLARMAQNTPWTELILMFEEIVPWCNFWYTSKNVAYAGIRTY